MSGVDAKAEDQTVRISLPEPQREPLDSLLELVRDMGLDLYWQRANTARGWLWKARRAGVLVELGETAGELLERLQALDATERAEWKRLWATFGTSGGSGS